MMAGGEGNKALANFNFIHEVELASRDETLHVNNVEFFQYFDTARSAYLTAVGCPGYDEERQFGHVVLSNHCDYRLTLNTPDTLLVGVKTLDLGQHSVKLGICIVSSTQNSIVADGYTVALTFDFEKHIKVAIPDDIIIKINALEGFDQA